MICWGKIGYDDQHSLIIPSEIVNNAQNVAPGAYHSCGYKSDSKIVCWGKEDSYKGVNDKVDTLIKLLQGGAQKIKINTKNRDANLEY